MRLKPTLLDSTVVQNIFDRIKRFELKLSLNLKLLILNLKIANFKSASGSYCVDKCRYESLDSSVLFYIETALTFLNKQ